MSRPNVLMLLFFLPGIWNAPELSAEEVSTLIVKAGEDLQVRQNDPELETLMAIDGGLMTVVESSFPAPTEAGEHWLATASRDPLGRVSTIQWQRLRVDASIPEVVVATEPSSIEQDGQRWVPGNTLALASAQDDLSGVAQLSLTAGEAKEVTDGDQVQLQLPQEGRFIIRGQAVDKVGWSSEEAILEISVDAQAPTGSLRVEGPQTSGPAGELVIGPQTQVLAEVEDAESGLREWTAHTDGSALPSPASWSGPWAAGPHQALAVAVDRVGNEGRIGPLEFVVDDAPPTISFAIENQGWNDATGSTWYVEPVRVRATAKDELAGVERFDASTDGSNFAPFEGQLDVEGDRLTLRARDRLGQERLENIRWSVDREPPMIMLRDPDGQAIDSGSKIVLFVGQSLEVEVRDDQTGLATAVHRLNEHRESLLPERIVFRDRGDFVLEIRATDNAGLESRSTWSIRVKRMRKGG